MLTFSSLIDLWWKIAITIAVIVIAGYNIYKAVDDSKKSSTKTSLSASTNGQTSNVDENMNDELEIKSTTESYLDCTSGSIVDSQAKFTFQPHNSDKVRLVFVSFFPKTKLFFLAKQLGR